MYPSLEDWLAIFYNSIPSFAKIAAADPTLPSSDRAAGAAAFSATYRAVLDALVAELENGGQPTLNCLELCRLR